jgi:hypothetical protein
MKNEQNDPVADGLAEVWRDAHHRRTQDISLWISNIFKRRQSFKSRLPHMKRRLRELLLASRYRAFSSENVKEFTGGRRGW